MNEEDRKTGHGGADGDSGAARTTMRSEFLDNIPRRHKLWLMTPEELAIFNLIGEVEKLGAHPLLTDTVVKLQEAREKLADWIDGKYPVPDKNIE